MTSSRPTEIEPLSNRFFVHPVAGALLAPAVRADVFCRHPRDGFSSELVALVRAEAAAVPGGRFALLRRCGLTTAVKLAPYPR